MRIVYLHGFASGPTSRKAQYFREKFAAEGVRLEIPQLDEGDFEHLTISWQLALIKRLLDDEPACLIGSSLGGYLAALCAARMPNVRRLVLMAPAFQFSSRWSERFSAEELAQWKLHGSAPVYHHGYREERPLHYGFLEDAANFEAEPAFRQPALIFHGRQDPVVPVSISEGYAARHPHVSLRLFDSGHELTDVLEPMWLAARDFLLFQKP